MPSEQAGALPNLMSPTGPPRAASDDPVDAENVPLPPLAEILDDTDHFRMFNHSNGNKRYECLWCHHQCSNVTKLIAHVNKIRNRGVKLCTEVIPEQQQKEGWQKGLGKVGILTLVWWMTLAGWLRKKHWGSAWLAVTGVPSPILIVRFSSCRRRLSSCRMSSTFKSPRVEPVQRSNERMEVERDSVRLASMCSPKRSKTWWSGVGSACSSNRVSREDGVES